eukprot:1270707-Ditylum_brightwellii.AAC.1
MFQNIAQRKHPNSKLSKVGLSCDLVQKKQPCTGAARSCANMQYNNNVQHFQRTRRIQTSAKRPPLDSFSKSFSFSWPT